MYAKSKKRTCSTCEQSYIYEMTEHSSEFRMKLGNVGHYDILIFHFTLI